MDGFLNINKPPDWTSHDVVAKVRGLLKHAKVGHTGTLDPMATGVLPLCIGHATKVAHYLVDADKDYRVVMRLGVTTDTQDATGRVLSRSEVRVSADDILRVLGGLVGPLIQIPPMYSAVKVNGEPLYKAAREGRVVERQPRTVTISRLEVLGIADGDVTFDVTCSKGTYVRTLCVEAGERLGVGASLQALERRRVGRFLIADARTVTEVEADVRAGETGRGLFAIDEVLSDLPAVDVDAATAERACHGVALTAERVETWVGICRRGDLVRIRTAGVTVALATALADQADMRGGGRAGVLKIERVLADPSVKETGGLQGAAGAGRGLRR
ncbi:MAG: tRNA pseudouridine(55) synthase TruB [Nitrospirae bacterium]|nr:tRNA pseudouridine(55) synthase TruB [Nitrospirota bacterium]